MWVPHKKKKLQWVRSLLELWRRVESWVIMLISVLNYKSRSLLFLKRSLMGPLDPMKKQQMSPTATKNMFYRLKANICLFWLWPRYLFRNWKNKKYFLRAWYRSWNWKNNCYQALQLFCPVKKRLSITLPNIYHTFKKT